MVKTAAEIADAYQRPAGNCRWDNRLQRTSPHNLHNQQTLPENHGDIFLEFFYGAIRKSDLGFLWRRPLTDAAMPARRSPSVVASLAEALRQK